MLQLFVFRGYHIGNAIRYFHVYPISLNEIIPLYDYANPSEQTHRKLIGVSSPVFLLTLQEGHQSDGFFLL